MSEKDELVSSQEHKGNKIEIWLVYREKGFKIYINGNYFITANHNVEFKDMFNMAKCAIDLGWV